MLPRFIELIDDCVAASYTRRADRPNNRHWPSEASCVTSTGVIGKCLREQFLERIGAKYDRCVTPRVIRIQKLGKAIEQMEIEHAKLAGIHIADDVEFVLSTGNIVVSGRMDALYTDDQGNTVCVEYKTGEGYWFERDIKVSPRPEHVMQVMCYLHAHTHIPYGIIMYVNRDKLDIIEHMVDLRDGVGYVNYEPTELTIDGIVSRWEQLTAYLDTGIMPPPDFCPAYTDGEVGVMYRCGAISKRMYGEWLNNGVTLGDMKCMYLCNFRSTCINEIRGKIPSCTDGIIDYFEEC